MILFQRTQKIFYESIFEKLFTRFVIALQQNGFIINKPNHAVGVTISFASIPRD